MGRTIELGEENGVKSGRWDSGKDRIPQEGRVGSKSKGGGLKGCPP